MGNKDMVVGDIKEKNKTNAESKKSVLILVPTNSVKSYIAGKFFKQLGKLDLSKADILFSDDTTEDAVVTDGELVKGRPDEYMNFIRSLGYECVKSEETLRQLALIKQQNPNATLRIRDRLCMNRENLRREFIKRRQYTHALWFDSDVQHPTDVVEHLLEHNKHVVSGVYWQTTARLNEQKQQYVSYEPVVYKYLDEETYRMHQETKCSFDNFGAMVTNEELNPSRLIPEDDLDIKVTAIGLGCVLMSREVMEKPWSFRYTLDTPGTEDMWMSLDLKKFGYQINLDTYIRCKHTPKPWVGPK